MVLRNSFMNYNLSSIVATHDGIIVLTKLPRLMNLFASLPIPGKQGPFIFLEAVWFSLITFA